MLQGVCSPFMLTTPIMGLASASSSRPIARMKALCGARSSPSVVTRDRHFFMPKSLSKAPAGAGAQATPPVRVPLLERRNDGGMLELRNIKLRQHPGFSIDIEHFLNRREVGRGTRVTP